MFRRDERVIKDRNIIDLALLVVVSKIYQDIIEEFDIVSGGATGKR